MVFLSTVATVATGFVATGAAILGVTHAGPATSTATPTTVASAQQLRVPCGAVWSRLPQDLRDDLTALAGLPVGQRPAAVEAIRRDALDGEYGDRVRDLARSHSDGWRRFQRLPEARQDRIREAVRQRLEDRREACVPS